MQHLTVVAFEEEAEGREDGPLGRRDASIVRAVAAGEEPRVRGQLEEAEEEEQEGGYGGAGTREGGVAGGGGGGENHSLLGRFVRQEEDEGGKGVQMQRLARSPMHVQGPGHDLAVAQMHAENHEHVGEQVRLRPRGPEEEHEDACCERWCACCDPPAQPLQLALAAGLLVTAVLRYLLWCFAVLPEFGPFFFTMPVISVWILEGVALLLVLAPSMDTPVHSNSSNNDNLLGHRRRPGPENDADAKDALPLMRAAAKRLQDARDGLLHFCQTPVLGLTHLVARRWTVALTLLLLILDACLLFIALLGAVAFCVEPDGRITVARRGLFGVFVTISVFTFLSAVARVVQLVVLCREVCHCCDHSCGSHSTAVPALQPHSASALTPERMGSLSASRWGRLTAWLKGGYHHPLRHRNVWAQSALFLLAFSFALYFASVHHVLLTQEYRERNDANYKGCDDLDETACLLPFPSSYFLEASADTPTGYALHPHTQALPYLRQARHLDAGMLDGLDGFSWAGSIAFSLPGKTSTDSLNGVNAIAESLLSNSTTLLIPTFAPTQRHPHFAELDALADSPRRPPLILMQPARTLRPSSRYVVVAQGIRSSGGSLIGRSPLMQSLLSTWLVENGDIASPLLGAEDCTQSDATCYMRYQNFTTAPDSVFPTLAAAGINISEVQLAFDFVTHSNATQIQPLHDAGVEAAQMMQHRLRTKGRDSYRVTRRDKSGCVNGETTPGSDDLWQVVHLVFDTPWVLKSSKRLAATTLHSPYASSAEHGTDLDADMRLHANDVGIMIAIPCSVVDKEGGSTAVNGLLQYGHGLFGSREELLDSYLHTIANDGQLILYSLDWRGMSRFDVPSVVRAMSKEPEDFQHVTGNLQQAFLSMHAALPVVRYFLDNDPNVQGLRDANPGQNMSSSPVSYYGNSLGGILGSGFVPFTASASASASASAAVATAAADSLPGFQRAVFGVPGIPFTFLLSRSNDFAAYLNVMRLVAFSGQDVRLLLLLVQLLYDPVEGSGYFVPDDDGQTYGNAVATPVLMNCGVGDSIVTVYGSDILARSVNASAQDPSSGRVPWGVETGTVPSTAASSSASLLEVLYQKAESQIPDDNTAPERNDVHICLRSDDDVVEQVRVYLTNGTITSACGQDTACVRYTCSGGARSEQARVRALALYRSLRARDEP